MMSGALWPVCGHNRVVGQLTHELQTNAVRHAYLISGPAHMGKWTIASAFAQAIICESGSIDGVACGKCDHCRRVIRGIHPDLDVFSLDRQRRESGDKSSGERLTVETIRGLCTSAALKPFSVKRRVIVLSDAQMMTEIAQEALLKTLEEPPAHLLLILLTDSTETLRSTIVSRCEQLSLLPVPFQTIEACLIAQGVEPGAAIRLAGQSFGRPGWAMLAAADESVARSESEALKEAIDWARLSPFGRMSKVFELAGSFGSERAAVFRKLEATGVFWRAVMMSKAGAMPGISLAEDDHSPASGFGHIGLQQALDALESVLTCVNDLESNVRPRLALEAMVLQWPTYTAPDRS